MQLRIYTRQFFALAIYWLICCTPFAYSSHFTGASTTSLTFAIPRMVRPSTGTQLLSPIVERLETGTKAKVNISTHSLEELLQLSRRQHFDIILVPAHFALDLHRRGVYQPLVKQNNNPEVILIFKASNPITRLEDLANKRVATIDKHTLASRMFLQQLARKKIPVTLNNAIRYDHALTALIKGDVDAALSTKVIVESLPEAFRKSLNYFNIGISIESSHYMLSTASDLDRDAIVSILVNQNNEENSTSDRGFAKKWKRFDLVEVEEINADYLEAHIPP